MIWEFMVTKVTKDLSQITEGPIYSHKIAFNVVIVYQSRVKYIDDKQLHTSILDQTYYMTKVLS